MVSRPDNAAGEGGYRPNILVVDDESATVKVLKAFLERSFNARITEAEGIATARGAMSSSEFDLVTLDYELEDGDGLSFLEEVNAAGDPPPVVMVTGRGDENAASEAFRLGAAGYVVKDKRLSSMLPAAAGRALDLARARRELRESEARFRSIVESAKDAVLILNPEGKITYWNPAAEVIFGYSREEAVGRDVIDLMVPWEYADNYRRMASAFFSTGTPAPRPEDSEFIVERKDGTWIPVEISSAELRYEGRLSAAVTVRDISERKKAERAMAESERSARRKLESILEPEGDVGAFTLDDLIDSGEIQSLMDDFYKVTNIGVAVVDLTGDILVATGWQDICTRFHRINPVTNAFCVESDLELSEGVEPGTFKIYKCKNNMWDMATPIMVGGKRMGNLFLGQFFFSDEEVDRDLFREQARRYGFDETEYMAALDRVPRWTRETVNDVMSFYTKLTVLVSSLGHGKVELARSLARTENILAQLRAANSKLEEYASTVSHDLKGPLASVSGAIDMAIAEVGRKDADRQIEILEIASGSLERAYFLIDSLLTTAEDTGESPSPGSQDVGVIVRSVIAEQQDLIQKKGASVDVSGDLGSVKADPTCLYQVFSNLLSNAVRHNTAPDPRVEVRRLPDESEGVHRFLVRDNGNGISSEDLADLFQPFRRHGASGGTGIGLAIVERNVNACGGRIQAYNDGGACFEFTLVDRA